MDSATSHSAFPVSDASTAAVPSVDQYLDSLHRLGRIRHERAERMHLEHRFHNVRFAGRRVLDIGAGDGFYAFYAALKRASEVVCLEPEAAGSGVGVLRQFDRVRRALPELPIRMEPVAVEHYRDTEGFDVILMNACINHIDEDACVRLREDAAARAAFVRVFAHIGTLARPGARLIVTDCARSNAFAALGVRNPLVPTIEWHKHQAPALWAELLAQAGFRDPRVRWESIYGFGKAVQVALANGVAAFFLKSSFILEMDKA